MVLLKDNSNLKMKSDQHHTACWHERKVVVFATGFIQLEIQPQLWTWFYWYHSPAPPPEGTAICRQVHTQWQQSKHDESEYESTQSSMKLKVLSMLTKINLKVQCSIPHQYSHLFCTKYPQHVLFIFCDMFAVCCIHCTVLYSVLRHFAASDLIFILYSCMLCTCIYLKSLVSSFWKLQLPLFLFSLITTQSTCNTRDPRVEDKL